MAADKTPGVYISEIYAFPMSLVPVATAVPAFVGYTETARHGTLPLKGRPYRISSMQDFEAVFGGPAVPMFDILPVADPAVSPMMDAARADMKDTRLVTVVPVRRADGATEMLQLQSVGEDYCLYSAMQLFFRNGGGPCYIVSVGGYGDAIDADALLGGLDALVTEADPTLVVIPETTRLTRADSIRVQMQMLAHCSRLGRRFAILDIFAGHLDAGSGNPVAAFRDAIGASNLDYGAAYYPWLRTLMHSLDDFTFRNLTGAGRGKLIALVEEAGRTTGKALSEHQHDILSGSGPQEGPDFEYLDKALRTFAHVYGDIMAGIATRMNTMAPAAAMAGLYTLVDTTRGVWAPPANVGLIWVAAPTVILSRQDQDDLISAPPGRSINAIRLIAGEGVQVCGARTLDGNSSDGRYVSVRRTMMMLEESIRLGVAAFAFEPNAATTWVMIRELIERFLASVWQQGALVGAEPKEAFAVRVGLGETMTQADVLEGNLRISVLVAIIRPAEFQEITVLLQVQKS